MRTFFYYCIAPGREMQVRVVGKKRFPMRIGQLLPEKRESTESSAAENIRNRYSASDKDNKISEKLAKNPCIFPNVDV